MAAGLFWPLTAAGAAIGYTIYKNAKNASALGRNKYVPDRYTQISPTFPEEYDDHDRATDIYLLFVTLENMELLGAFKSLQHWAVGCDFENRASIFELTGDPIEPCWVQWNMEESQNNFTHVIKLGSVNISPKKMRDLAAQNIYNNTR